MTGSTATQIIQTLRAVDIATFESDDDRQAVIAEARRLQARLEQPWETVQQLSWAIPCALVALKVGIDADLFTEMEAAGRPLAPSDLSTLTVADEELITRLFRHLCAMNLIHQNEEDKYELGRFTRALTNPLVASSMYFLFEMFLGILVKAPDFIAQSGFKMPTEVDNGIFQYATDTPGKSMFQWLEGHPKEQAHFIDLMSGYASERENWLDIYPIEHFLPATAQDGRTILVDVGGSTGHDALKLFKKFPETAGRIMVQDRAIVLKVATLPEGMRTMPHDFFTEQPLKDAHFYFLHSILHDWPDSKCLQILRQLRPAMLAKRSRLLLNDIVLPIRGATSYMTAMDLTMMSVLAAKERDEKEWKALLAEAGFTINRIYWGRVESVIEATPTMDPGSTDHHFLPLLPQRSSTEVPREGIARSRPHSVELNPEKWVQVCPATEW